LTSPPAGGNNDGNNNGGAASGGYYHVFPFWLNSRIAGKMLSDDNRKREWVKAALGFSTDREYENALAHLERDVLLKVVGYKITEIRPVQPLSILWVANPRYRVNSSRNPICGICDLTRLHPSLMAEPGILDRLPVLKAILERNLELLVCKREHNST
jgi:hypothetical protein